MVQINRVNLILLEIWVKEQKKTKVLSRGSSNFLRASINKYKILISLVLLIIISCDRAYY